MSPRVRGEKRKSSSNSYSGSRKATDYNNRLHDGHNQKHSKRHGGHNRKHSSRGQGEHNRKGSRDYRSMEAYCYGLNMSQKQRQKYIQEQEWEGRKYRNSQGPDVPVSRKPILSEEMKRTSFHSRTSFTLTMPASSVKLSGSGGEQVMKPKRIVQEVVGDLFTAPKTSSLAHCVAEDMRMGAGIAVTFKKKFKRVDELLAQGARTGQVAVLEDGGRFIYYLVTKKLSKRKPCLENLRSSLINMRMHMLANNVHNVAMPRIGCGLDRLQWYQVRMMLIEIFAEDNVSITVYNYNKKQNVRKQNHGSATLNSSDDDWFDYL